MINCKVNFCQLVGKRLELLSTHEFLLKVVQDLLAELIIPRILCKLRKLEIVIDVLRFINNKIPNVQAFLPLFQVLSRLILKAASPKSRKMLLSKAVIRLVILNNLLKLSQVLHFLDQQIGSVIRLTQERGYFRIENFPRLFNVLRRIRISLLLNV